MQDVCKHAMEGSLAKREKENLAEAARSGDSAEDILAGLQVFYFLLFFRLFNSVVPPLSFKPTCVYFGWGVVEQLMHLDPVLSGEIRPGTSR